MNPNAAAFALILQQRKEANFTSTQQTAAEHVKSKSTFPQGVERREPRRGHNQNTTHLGSNHAPPPSHAPPQKLESQSQHLPYSVQLDRYSQLHQHQQGSPALSRGINVPPPPPTPPPPPPPLPQHQPNPWAFSQHQVPSSWPGASYAQYPINGVAQSGLTYSSSSPYGMQSYQQQGPLYTPQPPPPPPQNAYQSFYQQNNNNNISHVSLYGMASATMTAPPLTSASSPPEPAQVWYCEPCDKEFTQVSAFNAHNATHENCRFPGCDFSGSKKVVIAHYHGKHGQFSGSGYKLIEVEGGQKFRVLMGTSPEEVAAWRADRRKKFPTATNLENKQKDLEALRAAGGVVPGGGGKSSNGGLMRGTKRPRASETQQKEKISKTNDENTGEAGIGASATVKSDSVAVGDGGGSSVDVVGEDDHDKSKVIRKRPCSFFARGHCKDGEACRFSHDFEPKMCTFFLRSGRCTRGNRCTFVHDREANKAYREEKKKQRGEGDSSGKNAEGHSLGEEKSASDSKDDAGALSADISPPAAAASKGAGSRKMTKESRPAAPRPAKREMTDDEARARAQRKRGQLFLPKPYSGGFRGTLLKKLLEDEIRSEENIVLQCIRFIVTNSFLQPPTTRLTESPVADGTSMSLAEGIRKEATIDVMCESSASGAVAGVDADAASSRITPAIAASAPPCISDETKSRAIDATEAPVVMM